MDIARLAAAGLQFWQTASTGYQIGLAPELVLGTSTDYKAFLAPAMFLIGANLSVVRIVSTTIDANGLLLRALICPLARRCCIKPGVSRLALR
ncbi:MAG: hypothetical protein ABIV25_13460 [Paracoccaceae bacterium]